MSGNKENRDNKKDNKAKWLKIKGQNTNKRNGLVPVKTEVPDFLVIQRVTAKPVGKQQKHDRINSLARVAFPFDEMTMQNIKDAIKVYYQEKGFSAFEVDILTTERGPTDCTSIDQIKSLDQIHCRLLFSKITSDPGTRQAEAEDVDVDEDLLMKAASELRPGKANIKYKLCELKRKRNEAEEEKQSNSLLPKPGSRKRPMQQSMSKLPKITFSQMIGLGRVPPKSPSQGKLQISISSCSFVCDEDGVLTAQWSDRMMVSFDVEEECFAKGAFRRAFRARSRHPDFRDQQWVLKRYSNPEKHILESGDETIYEHAKKQVQMHQGAKKIANEFSKEMPPGFGDCFSYNDIYLGMDGDEPVFIEDYIPGTFRKHVNNDGTVFPPTTDVGKKAGTFAHYSLVNFNRRMMVLDVQGVDYTLFDPEIATAEQFYGEGDSAEALFCAGNQCQEGIDKFVKSHECNEYCEIAELDPLTKDDETSA